MEVLSVVGSDVRQFSCPRCNCHDRERHLMLYLKQLAIFEKFKHASILHFAPERHLCRAIRQCLPARYIQCDLYPTDSTIEKIDMLKIPYASESFDFVIANHVLEHVDDDIVALTELHRVCKIGGMAILQTPYSSKLTSTFSDPGIDTDLARLTVYGQEDHVRLYGSDIFKRFASIGFVEEIAWHRDVLKNIDANFFGVNAAEPLFLFRRI
jgi:SAM-dependent methyltransferase